ncbi:MAG: hypothetical protein R6U15_05515 [Candidatus Izemoplasmatales bacterium]
MGGNKKIQIALVVFLFIGFIFTTTSAFSYWQEVTVANDVEIINIGEPVEIVVTDLNTSPETETLVPSGYAMQVTDVEYVTLTYQVGVSEELLNTVNLIISKNNVLINGDSTYSHLIDIDIMGMGEEATVDLFNDTITITVVVRLIEPIDLQEANDLGLDPSLANVEDSIAAYNAIKGQNVSFQLLFELENKE